ncbi:hypothetical protein ABDB91_04665 [Desulfoscipio sp. XC116]|uniref:hypothetical protein n=1 Tax=Desulfoscipio sp. XC116 TaxID=3144975 RepID=UPI00325AD7EC
MQSVNTASTNFQERRINSMRKRLANALLRAKAALMNPCGDQMTGWLIVVLIVVVVGAVFMTLYQGSITQIWNSIVAKITNLLN